MVVARQFGRLSALQNPKNLYVVHDGEEGSLLGCPSKKIFYTAKMVFPLQRQQWNVGAYVHAIPFLQVGMGNPHACIRTRLYIGGWKLGGIV